MFEILAVKPNSFLTLYTYVFHDDMGSLVGTQHPNTFFGKKVLVTLDLNFTLVSLTSTQLGWLLSLSDDQLELK